jgi:GNAT superfamily N-acetyltransferase
MSLTLRPYEPADQEAVLRVNERALRASPIEFVPGLDEDLRRIPEAYADGTFLVGEYSSTPDLVAMGGVRLDGERAELRRVRVDPDHRRQGYGRRVVRALEERAREAGVGLATLETNARLRAARELYEALGYEQVGSRTQSEHGVRLVAYERRL